MLIITNIFLHIYNVAFPRIFTFMIYDKYVTLTETWESVTSINNQITF